MANIRKSTQPVGQEQESTQQPGAQMKQPNLGGAQAPQGQTAPLVPPPPAAFGPFQPMTKPTPSQFVQPMQMAPGEGDEQQMDPITQLLKGLLGHAQ